MVFSPLVTTLSKHIEFPIPFSMVIQVEFAFVIRVTIRNVSIQYIYGLALTMIIVEIGIKRVEEPLHLEYLMGRQSLLNTK